MVTWQGLMFAVSFATLVLLIVSFDKKKPPLTHQLGKAVFL